MTVTHVVLVEFSDPADERIDVLRAAVRGLAGRIPIRSLVEGESNSPEELEGGFHYGFVVTFDSADARDVYLAHPDHLPVAAEIDRLAARVLVFDI